MMTLANSAPKLAGWTRIVDELPPRGAKVEVLHFGKHQDTATADQWGICPDGVNGHGKRSTVTHWRPREENQ